MMIMQHWLMPFHLACQVKATQAMLEILLNNIYPKAVKQVMTNTNDTALHCLLLSLSSRPSTNQEIEKTVKYLVEKNMDTLSVHK